MSYDEAVKIIGAGTKKGAQQGIPLMITKQMEKQLKDLGYSQEEIDKLKPEQAKNIIDNKIAKAAPQQQALTEEERMYDDLANNMVSIPWTSVVYDPSAPGNKRATSGSNKIIDFADRKIVVIPINGRNIPFYLSTGGGGKKGVPAGKWYPFFGLSEEGWFNKLGEKEINNYYGSEVLKGLSEALDRNIGDIRNDNTIPKVPSKGTHMDVINKDLNPTENEKADTRTIIESNIKDVVDFLKQSVSKPGQPTASTEEPVVLPIQNGTMQFSTSTETFAEYYSFEVKDGKIVSGKYRSSFQGEYRDSQEERPIPESELNSTYNKVKNYKDQKIKETTPAPKGKPGEQLDLFDQEEITSDDTVVIESLRGKVIYTSPGMNIQEAVDSDPFIFSGDDIIARELANSGIELFYDMTPENMTQKIAEFWNTRKQPGSKITESDIDAMTAAINRAYLEMKSLSDEGFTILTHSMALLNNPQTPLDLVITPTKGSVYKKAQSDVLRINERRSAELGARATKTHRVTDAESILEVLTGKSKIKASKATVSDRAFADQVSEIKSITSIADMQYEMSFMKDSELADLGVTRDEADKLLNDRLNELSKAPNFEDIAQGDILIDKDGTQLYVVWHNNQTGEMAVRPVGTKAKGEILKESNYLDKIKSIFAKGMNIQSTKPVVTPEEQKTAEDNIKASVAELDPAALREIENQIDTDEDSALDDIELC
jgi:hypothetical protein